MNGSKNKNKFRIDFRILSILSLIAAIPLLVGSWLLFKSYESAHLEVVGTNLSESADMVFTQLNGYLQTQIIVVAGLNEVPVIREVVKTISADSLRLVPTTSRC